MQPRMQQTALASISQNQQFHQFEPLLPTCINELWPPMNLFPFSPSLDQTLYGSTANWEHPLIATLIVLLLPSCATSKIDLFLSVVIYNTHNVYIQFNPKKQEQYVVCRRFIIERNAQKVNTEIRFGHATPFLRVNCGLGDPWSNEVLKKQETHYT